MYNIDGFSVLSNHRNIKITFLVMVCQGELGSLMKVSLKEILRQNDNPYSPCCIVHLAYLKYRVHCFRPPLCLLD